MNAPDRPSHLDVHRFARDQGVLESPLDLAHLQRVRDELRAHADTSAIGHFRADGSVVAQRGGAFETWLQLSIEAQLPMQCQRCLGELTQALHIERRFRFVTTEAQAEKLDQEIDDDVLVASKTFDLWALIEDEMLMAMPFAVKHEVCPQIDE
jgi:uncharacterized protein